MKKSNLLSILFVTVLGLAACNSGGSGGGGGNAYILYQCHLNSKTDYYISPVIVPGAYVNGLDFYFYKDVATNPASYILPSMYYNVLGDVNHPYGYYNSVSMSFLNDDTYVPGGYLNLNATGQCALGYSNYYINAPQQFYLASLSNCAFNFNESNIATFTADYRIFESTTQNTIASGTMAFQCIMTESK